MNRLTNHKKISITEAEKMRRAPCAWCYRTSTKRWVCPHTGHLMELRSLGGVVVLQCPHCGLEIVQAAAPVKGGAK